MAATLYFLLWALLFFVLMRFGCGAHVMGHGHRHHGADDIVMPKSATDPVCGMKVETATAKSTVHDKHIYYFCSAKCRDSFEASPRTYINRNPDTSGSMEEHHGAH